VTAILVQQENPTTLGLVLGLIALVIVLTVMGLICWLLASFLHKLFRVPDNIQRSRKANEESAAIFAELKRLADENRRLRGD
jgi:uncharacterized protein HemY